MPSQITVTGKIGPAQTLTSKVFSNVSSFTVNPATGALEINQGGTITTVDIAAATTFTVTISGTNYTVVIS